MTELPQTIRPSLPAVRGSADMLAMIGAAASDASVDADKMVTLAKLATELQDRERQAQFSADKVAAIAELPAIFKAGKSEKHRYAKWEDMHRRIMPILSRHSLTLTHEIGHTGNMVTIEAVLEHANGIKQRGGPLPLPSDTGPGRNAVQAVASTVAYGKRITGKAILNIIESDHKEDDDGESATAMAPAQRDLLNEAERAARGGVTSYTEWFRSKGTAAKGWLAFEGHHDRLKAVSVGAGE